MPDILVEFDRSLQSLGALQEASYRLIDLASCIVDANAGRYLCRLSPKDVCADRTMTPDELRSRFIDLVTDENLREKVSAETGRVRDVILALAFGALARRDDTSPSA